MKKPKQKTLEEIIENQTNRRQVLRGIMAAGGAMASSWCFVGCENSGSTGGSSLEAETTSIADAAPSGFSELPHVFANTGSSAKSIDVADGYSTQVFIKWGDPIVAGSTKIDFDKPTPEEQAKQFGYNNDFVAYLPFERGSSNSKHGFLVVNHEYTNPELMFEGVTYKNKVEKRTEEQIRVEAAAHGHSVVEIKQDSDLQWHIVSDSKFNRRFTLNTKMILTGPAAGHPRMKTSTDSTGREVFGTVSNCSGGVTPWGTVLSGEENFHFYFRGKLDESSSEKENHERFGVKGYGDYSFFRVDDRFKLNKTPNEPNRFGWVVEIDPYDENWVPVKRTAMGRFKHEGAATAVNHDGRVVVYSGDDERFEYLYKFVTKKKYDPSNPSLNRDLLDEGTLYVARFDEKTVEWFPLEHGKGPLTAENGFESQADVVIETRRAADLYNATPMDRPEDVEANPKTHNVFVVLTNNDRRTDEQIDAPNPRAQNKHGHILELSIPQIDGKPDHAATKHEWRLFLKAGHLQNDDAWYQGSEPVTWLSCPDNCAFDNQGRLWISTDGAEKTSGILDGAYMCEVEGPDRALTKQFFHVPIGAELCGPCFTPDNSTLFVAIQHPGEYSTRDEPTTRWPNPPNSDLPPQPSIVAITKKGGGPVGT